MVAGIGPAKDQASQYSSIEMEGIHKTPLLAEELLAIDGHWERKNTQYSSVVWLLIGGHVPVDGTL